MALSKTRPWDKRIWKKLAPQSRQHLLDLALDKPITYYSLMRDLGFSVREAKEIKEYRLEGGLVNLTTGGSDHG